MYDPVDNEAGYDIEAEIGAVQSAAASKGIKLSRPTAAALVQARTNFAPSRLIRPALPGRGSGMGTSHPIGTATVAAGTAAGTLVTINSRAEEPMTVDYVTIERLDYAAVPPPVCAGLPVQVRDIRIGQRSVLAAANGLPVSQFDARSTGGFRVGSNVLIHRGTLVTVDFILAGTIAVPVGENIYLTTSLTGHE